MRLGCTVIVCCGVLVMAGCARPEPVDGIRADTAPIDGPRATIVVHGMSCPLCAANVERELSEVPGVATVALNLDTGEVAVTFGDGERPSKADLAEAIDRTGFTLKGIYVP
jgi:copper chaperone CopZ